ncbi:MAG: UDP-4-amino-4,6-dideoxy-N-acetyl-beta-L-altrosamine transaminase [Chthoniobacterales bacterium]
MSSPAFIPYGKQSITEEDVHAVIQTLQSDWLTTGPKVHEFERDLAGYCGAQHAVAVNSGTAALHCAMAALDIKPGDEVIVPAISFVATANCVVYRGGTPIFADVHADSVLIDAVDVARKITPQTKAIIAVDYAGQPADYSALRDAIGKRDIALVADACHSIGGTDADGRKAGNIADLSAFSFHPVKPITSGEGGAITTNNAAYDKRMRAFRNHGIDTDHREREKQGAWHYDMQELGFNYRLTDFQCALASSQLKKLDTWVTRRAAIAEAYLTAFAEFDGVSPLKIFPAVQHAWHIFVVLLKDAGNRDAMFTELRRRGIGANVHYRPIYQHTYYRNAFPSSAICPVAEKVFPALLTLPLHVHMTNDDVRRVIKAVKETAEKE